jgi:transposase-like protein
MSKSLRTIFCRWCGASGARRFGKDRSGRQRFHCPYCERTFIRRTRTLQSGSRLTDAQWTSALRLFSTRAGMSAEDLSRVLGINRKTAQKLNRSFRHLTRALVPRALPGISEWDESVFSRQWVLGGVSRQGKQCVLQCIPNRTEDTLVPLVERHSDPEGAVFTDEWGGYLPLANHLTVCHSREFVSSLFPTVHTNTQEGVWGHCKTLSWHTYRGIPRSSLPQFLCEMMFRYNIRDYRIRVSVLSALLSRKIHTLLV